MREISLMLCGSSEAMMRSMLQIVGFLRCVVTSIISFMSFTSFLLRLKRCKITAQTIKAPANLCALIIHSLYSPMAKFSPVNASRQIPQARAQTIQNLYITSTFSNANLSEKILSAFRRSHFGNYNQTTKFIWFIVGISPLVLSISGLYLWFRKFKRRKK